MNEPRARSDALEAWAFAAGAPGCPTTLVLVPRAFLVQALGAVIRIDGSALTDEAWAATRSAWQDAAAEPAAALAPATTVVAQGGFPAQAMLTGLSSEVTLAAIEDRAGELLMLHAAGLATTDGRVVALVGPSGRGKTTASRVLGREFGYVSDETVAIAADGTVLPYRKPLSLVENDRLPKVQRSPTELGLRPLPGLPLRLAALVLLERTDDADPATLHRVGLDEGIAGLAQQASYLGRMSAPLHVIASHIEAVGGVHRITYSNAQALTPLIHELGAREPDPPRMEGERESTVAPLDSSAATGQSIVRWRRIPALDTLTLDEQQLALLVRDDERSARVVVLDGLGPTLWRNAARPASLAELVRAAVGAHGEPVGAHAEELVAKSLADLTEAGLLTRL